MSPVLIAYLRYYERTSGCFNVADQKNIAQLQQQLVDQQHELDIFNHVLQHEQAISQKIFNEILNAQALQIKNLRYQISPAALFRGDVIMVARNGLGELHLFLGDFTGHGLVAAIGALPLKDIFYTMVKEGKAGYRILKEMNKKLCRILPKDLFCAVSYLVMDEKQGTAKILNGGMPVIRVCRQDTTKPDVLLTSVEIPLGILDNQNYEKQFVECSVSVGDRIFLHSDGLMKLENASGGRFGIKQIQPVFENRKDVAEIFDQLIESALEFSGQSVLADDCTLLEYTVANYDETFKRLDTKTQSWLSGKMDWQICLDLPYGSLKYFDPMPLIGKILEECPALEARKSELATIFVELFVNALEHGVLGLDSKIKKDPAGMMQFYQIKDRALSALTTGHIQFVIQHGPHPRLRRGGSLRIQVTDSGQGFDYKAYQRKKAADTHSLALSGRGIQLIHSLAASIEYKGKGNSVEVIYLWE